VHRWDVCAELSFFERPTMRMLILLLLSLLSYEWRF
jgi:hypothetical protein